MHVVDRSRTPLVDPTRQLTEQDYEHLDHLLGKHFAQLSIEIIKLAAFGWPWC